MKQPRPCAQARRPAAPGPPLAAPAPSAAVAAPPCPPPLAPLQLAPRPLHQRIREADSCWEVACLVQRAQRCSVPDLTAAVHRVVRLHLAAARLPGAGSAEGGWHAAGDGGGPAALRALLALATTRLPQLDAWAVAQCLRAAASLQQPLAGTAAEQAAWQARVAALLPGARPQSAATILWAAAKLGWSLDASLAGAATAAVRRTARGMNAQDAATVLYALAAGSSSSGGGGSSSSSSDSSSSSCSSSNGNSSSGWAAVASAAQPALQDRLTKVLPSANTQDVSNSLWAAARLGWQLECPLAAAADAAVLRAAPSMGPQALSAALWAYASRGWVLGGEATAAAQQQLIRLLPTAPPQAVANSLMAASRLGWQLDGRLAAAAHAALAGTLPRMTAEGAVDAAWALGHAGWQLSTQLRAPLAAALLRALPHASVGQLADVCKCFGRLRWDPGPELLAAAAAAVERLLARSLPPPTGHQPADDCVAAASASTAVAPSPAAGAQALRNLLWSLAELQQPAPPRLLELAAAWLAAQLAPPAAHRSSAGSVSRASAVEACDAVYCLARLGARLDGGLLDAAAAR